MFMFTVGYVGPENMQGNRLEFSGVVVAVIDNVNLLFIFTLVSGI